MEIKGFFFRFGCGHELGCCYLVVVRSEHGVRSWLTPSLWRKVTFVSKSFASELHLHHSLSPARRNGRLGLQRGQSGMDQFFAKKSFTVCTVHSTAPLLWGYHGLLSLRHRPFRMFQLKGCDYVLIVDYYSRFPEVISLKSTSAQAAISAVKSCMACYGIPNVVRTDIEPQFASHKFADFAQAHRFRHETRSQ
ncbi:uncharacterized protein ISCGN_002421 [Ixodes scapularis]